MNYKDFSFDEKIIMYYQIMMKYLHQQTLLQINMKIEKKRIKKQF